MATDNLIRYTRRSCRVTYPHCRDGINNHWTEIQAESGDQLHVLFINVTTEQGSQVMRDATTSPGIQSNDVPMPIIGSDILVGSIEIPMRNNPAQASTGFLSLLILYSDIRYGYNPKKFTKPPVSR